MSHGITYFVEYRISMIFLLAFLYLFMEQRYSKKKTFFIMTIAYLLSTFFDYVQFFILFGDEYTIIFSVIQAIIAQGIAFLISDYRDWRSLFIGTTAAAYCLLGNIAVEIIITYYNNPYVALIVGFLLYVFYLCLMVFGSRDELLVNLKSKNNNWFLLFCLPFLFYICIYSLTVWPLNIKETPKGIVPVFLIFVLMCASFCMVTKIFRNQREFYYKNLDREHLEIYVEQLKKSADRLVEKEEETAVIRHDMKHYCILLDGLIKHNEISKALELTKKINDNIVDSKDVRYCENLAISAIISNYAHNAENQHINFKVDVVVPQKLSFDEYEFAAVISNLLDNAMNAASMITNQDNRKVSIIIRIIKEQMILEISNTYEKKVVISDKTGLPISKKGEGHGYGVRSVRAFTDKYGADFDYVVEDGRYITRILIRI